ncbi:unnamed protein product [Bathycoccus prasinos]
MHATVAGPSKLSMSILSASRSSGISASFISCSQFCGVTKSITLDMFFAGRFPLSVSRHRSAASTAMPAKWCL